MDRDAELELELLRQQLAEAAVRDDTLVQQLAEAAARDKMREQQLAEAAARDKMREQQLADAAAANERGTLLAMVSNPVFLTQNISSLAQRINDANLELIDEVYLKSYLARDSPLDLSVTYVSVPPTPLTSTNDNASIAMSTVRLGRVAHRPKIYFWEIDEVAASALVCGALFESDVGRMQGFVDAHAARIASLRRLLRYAEEKGCGASEASLQIFFLAFLKEFVAALDPTLSATVAQPLLSLSLFVREEEGPPTMRTVNGHTDLMVWDTTIGTQQLDEGLHGLRFHVELKKPFGKLYQKKSDPEKDQTIVENEAIFQMTGQPVCGALSDLFCLAACICFADPDSGEDCPEDCNPGPPSAHFFARRVTDETKFVERLLMLLCGPEALRPLLPPRGDWRTLVVGEGAGEEGGDAASERAGEDGNADAPAAAAGPQVQARASRSATARSLSGRGNGGETKKAAPSHLESSEYSPCKFLWDKENRREEAELARQYVYQWECRREGLAPLTVEELRRRAQSQPATL